MTKDEFDEITESVIAQVISTIVWSSESEKEEFINCGARMMTSPCRKDIPDDVVAAIRAASITWVVIALTLTNLVSNLDELGLGAFVNGLNIEGISMANFYENLNTSVCAARALLNHIEV